MELKGQLKLFLSPVHHSEDHSVDKHDALFLPHPALAVTNEAWSQAGDAPVLSTHLKGPWTLI